MINNNKVIDNIQKNIAVLNFKTELNSTKNDKEYTHKKYWRIYKMKKIIISITCCSLILVSGIGYAYNSNHFKLGNNFLKIENTHYSESIPNDISEDELKERKWTYLNQYLIVGLFNQTIGKNTDYEYKHKGIDIAAQIGMKITAVASGTIKEVNSNSQYGNYILVKNDEEYETLYANLGEIKVKEGDSISQGEEIGTVGISGNVVAPILHFELRYNGEPIDPLDYIDRIDNNN